MQDFSDVEISYLNILIKSNKFKAQWVQNFVDYLVTKKLKSKMYEGW